MTAETFYPNETNPLNASEKLTWDEVHSEHIYWDDPRLAKVTRLRLVTDGRMDPTWGLSYCWGELKDGTRCVVSVPFMVLPKTDMMGALIKLANKDGVNLKKLGVFDAISKLW